MNTTITLVIILWIILGVLGVRTANKYGKYGLIFHWSLLGPLFWIVLLFDFIQQYYDNR